MVKGSARSILDRGVDDLRSSIGVGEEPFPRQRRWIPATYNVATVDGLRRHLPSDPHIRRADSIYDAVSELPCGSPA
jgi:hypothetical protein